MGKSNARLGFGAALTVAVLAVGGIAAFQWWQSQPPAPKPSPPPPQQPAKAPEEPATTPQIRTSCRFQVGDELGFDVQETRTWRLDLAQDADNPLPLDLAGVKLQTRYEGQAVMRWRLDLRAVKATETKGMVFVAQVSRPVLATPQTPREFGPERITMPFLIRLASNCGIETMARHTRVDPRTARVQQALAQQLTYRLPSDTGRAEYTEIERDSIGAHTHEYAIIDGQTPRLQRRQTGTSEFYMFDPRTGSVTMHTDGGTSIVAGDRGWFAQLERDQTRWFRDGPTYTRVRSQMVVRAAPPQRIKREVKDTVNEWVWGDLFAVRSAVLEADKDGALTGLQGMPVATVRRMLHELLADAALDPTAAVDLARDWLRANPALVPELVTDLRGSDASDNVAGLLLLGLRLTNDPANHRALVGLAADVSQPLHVRLGAIVVLSGSRLLEDAQIDQWRPWIQTDAAATSTNGKLARGTLAVLGHVARLQRNHQPRISHRITNILRDQLSTTQNDAHLVTVLTAIGNAGDDTMVDLIVGRQRSDDSQVRSAVARATGKLHPRTAHSILDEWVGMEVEATVRSAIAESTATRILLHRTDHEALRFERGPSIALLGAALEEGKPWARKALNARLEAERKSDEPNVAVTAEIESMLTRFAPPTR